MVGAEFFSRFRQAFTSSTFEVFADPFAFGMVVLGAGVLYLWHVCYGCPGAVEKGPVRRTRIHPFFSLALVFLWLIAASMIASALGVFHSDSNSTAFQAAVYALNALLDLAMIAGLLFIAHHTFARRFRGIGLNPGTLSKDLRWSPVYLAAVYPLVLFGLWVVLFAGRLFDGADYAMQEHQSLQTLTVTDSALMRGLIVLFAVVIVPVFEELLFRGFVQTSITASTGHPWLSIAATSLLFTVLHPWQHQIGLFFLSCGFGYAYERSGSLFRPIIMHVLFNGLSVTAVFLQQSLQNA
jgi:membrane protease YdiL (CAAX protease family)